MCFRPLCGRYGVANQKTLSPQYWILLADMARGTQFKKFWAVLELRRCGLTETQSINNPYLTAASLDKMLTKMLVLRVDMRFSKGT
jgi:hypothetical protein